MIFEITWFYFSDDEKQWFLLSFIIYIVIYIVVNYLKVSCNCKNSINFCILKLDYKKLIKDLLWYYILFVTIKNNNIKNIRTQDFVSYHCLRLLSQRKEYYWILI